MDRPKILHIFTDQQRFDTIRALGNPVIKTPRLDQLCARGVAMRNAFTPSPVCISARCSMIHGQYPMRTGCYANTRMPTDGRQTFMSALTDAGYRTHAIGKCHFTPDPGALRGFQSRETIGEVKREHFDLAKQPYLQLLIDSGYDHVSEVFGARSEMYYVPQVSQLPARLHPTQWMGDRAVAFINEQARRREPWYLFVGFEHPHPPFNPPDPWHKLYRAPLMPLPNVPADAESLCTYVNRLQNRYKYRDEGIDRHLVRCMKAYYYACISFIDFQIGRMLDALEGTGADANTLVIFTSDHGEHLGDYNCFGKRSMHDSSARIPLILQMPGCFEGGRACDVPVSLVDLAPTVLARAQAEVTSHQLDGVDLAGVLSESSTRSTVFAQYAEHYEHSVVNKSTEAVRAPAYRDDPELARAAMSTYMAVSLRWKYVYSAPDNCEFLFDKLHDPLETRNRAGVPHCRDAEADMRRMLYEHLASGGETAGIDGGRWRWFERPELPRNPDAGLLVQEIHPPWVTMHIPDYSDSES